MMNLSLAAKSLSFFLLSVLFLVLLTLFEGSLTGISLTTERILSLLLLVAPALVGIVLGVLSRIRKEPRAWLGILGVLLNTLFALVHGFLLAFAG
jgi:hypothetical protein